MGGLAQDFYNQGISISFVENGLQASDAATYAANNVLVPAAFTDNSGQTGNNAVAPSTIKIAWSATDPFETNLERIITQKWIAMYPDGPEGWAEFRRTGILNFSLLSIITAPEQSIQLRKYDVFLSLNQSTITIKLAFKAVLLRWEELIMGALKLWWDKKN